MKLWGAGDSSDSVTFQVQLHEGSFAVKMIYPDTELRDDNLNTGASSAAVGVVGKVPSEAQELKGESGEIASGMGMLLQIQ